VIQDTVQSLNQPINQSTTITTTIQALVIQALVIQASTKCMQTRLGLWHIAYRLNSGLEMSLKDTAIALEQRHPSMPTVKHSDGCHSYCLPSCNSIEMHRSISISQSVVHRHFAIIECEPIRFVTITMPTAVAIAMLFKLVLKCCIPDRNELQEDRTMREPIQTPIQPPTPLSTQSRLR
jgi:hypothetical protein